ncbi:hypothetical protein OIN60_17810 [Paenibacillus sp. P96]|uniref:Flagellar protein FliT n=1 Tax=Paenibacillus zeirhizosphaerae TaxID=2987519 RepID=A0ABT9FVQ0_9BACL|nr:hypothetical protein [Paenibacillus sp. P96]MDP4098591.1 hypothetical protein [Paenibacillus sp. P96]
MNNDQAEINAVLERLSNLTERFVVQLEDKTSEEVEAFVSERQMVVDQLQQVTGTTVLNDKQKKELANILSYDERIQQHMLSLRNNAQQWLMKRNAAKVQKNVYESRYTPDSYLMDKRK